MELNDEGFWFPQVNEVKCIHCGVCARSCPSQCHIELNGLGLSWNTKRSGIL